MKGIHWSVWVMLVLLIAILVKLSARREGYATPRDENTEPPFTENVGNTVTTSNNLPYVDSVSTDVKVDNQTDVYKDMGGLDVQIQAENPILNFIQGDPSSNVMYGDFVPNESDGGSARMYAYINEDSNVVPENNMLPPVPENPTFTPDAGQYIPSLTSPTIPYIGVSASELPASAISPEESQQRTLQTQV